MSFYNRNLHNVFRPKRGSKAQANRYLCISGIGQRLKEGEMFFELPENSNDQGAIKLGDGTHNYEQLPYFINPYNIINDTGWIRNNNNYIIEEVSSAITAKLYIRKITIKEKNNQKVNIIFLKGRVIFNSSPSALGYCKIGTIIDDEFIGNECLFFTVPQVYISTGPVSINNVNLVITQNTDPIIPEQISIGSHGDITLYNLQNTVGSFVDFKLNWIVYN